MKNIKKPRPCVSVDGYTLVNRLPSRWILALALAVDGLFVPVLQAANSSWNVNAAGGWGTSTNWLGSEIPGATSGVASTDIATFNYVLTAGRAVTVDANRNIGGITFSNTSSFGYTLSGGNLLLSNGGVIQTTAGNGNHTDTISSAIAIQGDGGSATFTAGATSASSLLNIGAVTGASTAGNITTLTLNGSNTGLNNMSGVIGDGSSGGKLALVKDGEGTWLISGINTFSGATTINAGVVRITKNTALGIGSLLLNGGELQLWASPALNTTVAGNARITSDQAVPNVGTIRTLGALSIGGQTLTIGGGGNIISGTASVSFGATTLTGNSTFKILNSASAATALMLGTVATGGNTMTLTGDGILTSGVWSGGGGLTLDSNFTGLTTFSANNQFTGALTINSGRVIALTYSSALSASALNLNGGELVLQQTQGGIGLTTVTGTSAWIRSDAKNGIATSGSTWTLAGLSIGGATLNIGAGSLVTGGTATVGFGSATTLTGATTFNIINSASATAALQLAAVNTAGNTLTLTGNGRFTQAGALADSGGLTLDSGFTGTASLSYVNTYTGATTIAGGTLALSSAGSIANSSVIDVGSAGSTGAVLDVTAKTGNFTVGAAQKLKGIGTVNATGKTVTVNGILAPGNSIGTLNVTGALTMAAGSSTEIELGNSTGTGTRLDPYNSDRTAVSGALALSGTLNLIDNATANGNGSVGAGSYEVFTQTGLASGSFSAVNNVTGYHAKVDTSVSGSVFVDNYQIAAANTLPATVDLGITHVGQGFTNSALSIQNTSASNGYAEGLNATQGATLGGATFGGSNVSNLAGGATSTDLTVGFSDTSTAGLVNGIVAVDFASNGANSGYSNTSLGGQVVEVVGQVNEYAQPTFTFVSGDGGLIGSGTSYTLNLGSFDVSSGSHTTTISLNNILLALDAAFQDDLGGTFSVSGLGISLSDLASDVWAGTSQNLTVTFDTTGLAANSYTGLIQFNSTSVNMSGSTDRDTIDVALEFQVVPEPSTWAMVVGGMGVLMIFSRMRRDSFCLNTRD